MAKTSKFVAPNLDNATPEFLLDEMGKLSIMESQVKRLRAFYKEAYYARTGIKLDNFTLGGSNTEVREGDTFIATTSRSDPNRVNVSLLKEKYPEIAAEVTESKGQLTTRFSLKEGVVNPIVNDLIAQMKAELDLDD